MERFARGMPPVEAGQEMICAVSGGPDSMLLLSLLLELQREKDFSLVAAHLHHGIRGAEADRDEAFVQGFCREKGIAFAGAREDVPQQAKERGMSLELAARECRRAFLLKLMEDRKAACIALGHHADDQAETVLMNLMRGSGLKGLCGMSVYTAPWWRPLLPFPREELMGHVARLSIPYQTDSSNLGPEYRRNRMRALLADLKKENPAAAKNIAKSADLLAQDEAYLQELAAQELERLLVQGELMAAALANKPQALASRVLRLYLQGQGLWQNVEQKHIAGLLEAIAKGKNAVLDLPGGRRFALEYGRLFPEPLGAGDSPEGCWPLNLAGRTQTPWGQFYCREVSPTQTWPPREEHRALVGAESLRRACIRGRRPGDWIQPFGMDGRKKLKDFFIDLKAPKRNREGPLLALDDGSSEILWAVGAGLSQKCAWKPGEKLLQIDFSACL